jgi:aspartate aminotransferase-like enzyme
VVEYKNKERLEYSNNSSKEVSMSPMFVPGPVDVSPDVLQQQTKAMMPHRSKDFKQFSNVRQKSLSKSFTLNTASSS